MTNAERLVSWLGCRCRRCRRWRSAAAGPRRSSLSVTGRTPRSGSGTRADPERVLDRRDTYVGQQVTIFDNRGTCAHSGFCSDRLRTAFRPDQEPFVAPTGGRMDEIIAAVRACPSGALSFALGGHEAREQVDQEREQAIEVSKDGPYRVTGGLPLEDADGNPERRNEGASLEHYSLCRCGHSRNKPFCSGRHWQIGFRDPVPDPEQEPTLFEWAGGFPALTRMTRIFYGKYVPQDPLLAPLFANMSPDHPERVAAWLGEVFGGPKAYSEGYGGYERMVSQHLGKALREEQRARWVELLSKSADDAMLPADPEWRAAFVAYLEWGSRIGLENSQPGPIRRRTCRCRAGGGSATRRRAGGSPHWPPRSLRVRSTFPAPASPSVSSSTSSRCSASVTGSRCVSRSTSGRTPTSASTRTRFSTASVPGRCPATGLARRAGRGVQALAGFWQGRVDERS